MGPILLIVVAVFLVGALPVWGYNRNWGYATWEAHGHDGADLTIDRLAPGRRKHSLVDGALGR